jgi:hypothetical protein
LDILLGSHELKLLKLPFLDHVVNMVSILSVNKEGFSNLYLVVIFHTDNLAHKLVHTFEKMDAINPTFELIEW